MASFDVRKRKTAPSPNVARTRTLSILYLEVTASCMPPKLMYTARRVSHPSTAHTVDPELHVVTSPLHPEPTQLSIQPGPEIGAGYCF